MHKMHDVLNNPHRMLVALLLMVGVSIAPLSTVAQQGPAQQGPDKLDHHLLALAGESSSKLAVVAPQTAGALQPYSPTVRDGMVLVDAIADGDVAELERSLVALGLQGSATNGRICSGWLPVAAIGGLSSLSNLKFASASLSTNNVGLTTSQGDAAMRADLARDEFGVDGSGVTVGVISDSYDALGGAATDVGTGDLPAGVVVLEDDPTGTDEGRAMMQLIHDVAPGASQAFHTSSGGQANFANGILDLASVANADVIVDDILYLAEPMFQDGIIAQAVDAVEAIGVSYFSAAGNSARDAFEDRFRSSGIAGVFGGDRHDFNPGAGVDDLQSFVLAGNGATTIFAFQWDQPAFSVSGVPGSASDMDIILYLKPDVFIGLGGFADNIGGDPVEVFGVVNTGPDLAVNLGLELFTGPSPSIMKYVFFTFGGVSSVDEFDRQSGSIYGHANAEGAEAVGAARYSHTPPFGIDPPLIEPFSSAGPTPIVFATDGSRQRPERRLKPEITAPDGTNTTFFGFDYEPDGFPNFFGTSAAAPHAAAVAALLIDEGIGADGDRSNPQRIYRLLERTATDMDDPATPGFDHGFDFGTGYGLIDACRALFGRNDGDCGVGSGEDASKQVITQTIGTTPLNFALNDNYPNPVASATTIGFDMPEARHVMLEVFDVTGRLVETLVDQPLSAGRHRVRWTADGLPSGLYLYQLTAGEFRAAKRMMFVR